LINIRHKGQEGEREFCRWLQKTLELDFLPTRNLDQTRNGGADILGIGQFVFEIKRCEALEQRQWWIQVVASSTPSEMPVVAYRQNKRKWNFLISAKHIGLDKGFIHLQELEFSNWIKGYFIK